MPISVHAACHLRCTRVTANNPIATPTSNADDGSGIATAVTLRLSKSNRSAAADELLELVMTSATDCQSKGISAEYVRNPAAAKLSRPSVLLFPVSSKSSMFCAVRHVDSQKIACFVTRVGDLNVD